MEALSLDRVVEEFAQLTCRLPDADLERAWTWQDYDEEGVRFAFFRIYEELRELAANLGKDRAECGNPITKTQRILAQYHAAYRDLQAVLLGISDEEAGRQPAEGERPVRKTLTHIVRTKRTFFAINSYALERSRKADDLPAEMSDEAWEAFWEGDHYLEIEENEPLAGLLAYYDGLHSRVLREFAAITEDELHVPATFWESIPMPIQFRLHRFDSHLRQHTVQIEKTLEILGLGPNEARRLLRLIYNALAEAEGTRIGEPQLGVEQFKTLAMQISKWTGEVKIVIAG